MEGLEYTCSSLVPAVLNFLHLSEVQWEPRVITASVFSMPTLPHSGTGASVCFLAALR